jgi:hypothetical protein
VLDFFMLQLSKLDWQKGVIALGVLGCVVLLVAIVLVWRHQRTSDPLKGLKPGVYQSTQHVSGETLPLPAPKR